MNGLLLAKSNFKKKRSTSIIIGLLMLISTILISMSLLLFLDAFPNTDKYASKLNAGDGYSIIYNDLTGITDTEVENIVKDKAYEYEIDHFYYLPTISIPFMKGDLVTQVIISNKNALNRKMERAEIEMEDNNITSNYIYLPYQFYSNGTNKIGDTYTFSANGKEHSYTVRGYINTFSFGNRNCGEFEFILDDDSYFSFISTIPNQEAILVSYKLNDGITQSKMKLTINNTLSSINTKVMVNGLSKSDIIFNRGYMSLILAISFLTINLVSACVIVLMLYNTISNYVKENMKEIGALKALGYTSFDILKGLLVQFLSLAIIGGVLGVILGYSIMPILGPITSIQQGLPYTVSFNTVATFIPPVIIVLLSFLGVILSTRKIKRITPIIALREGLLSHNFKKNRVALDKSSFGLNISLALKTFFNNMKQNIITFVVIGFLTFICGTALMMYENFNRNPKIDILAFESCGGVVTVENSKKEELRSYLEAKDGVSNVRTLINVSVIYGDNDESLMTYIIDDINHLNNKNICYEGRLVKYDNEICISGKFAKAYGYHIGDEIEISYAGNKAKYLISGFIQSTNNNGKEALMIEEAAKAMYDFSSIPGYFWFDGDKEVVTNVLKECEELYGEAIITTMNFYTILEAGMASFEMIAALMLVISLVISLIVILLVLYLLIKSLLHNKQKEYGILKALGYSSKDLILQTAISFMPSIIISVVLFSIVSYFLINPYMNLIMINFGLMKCSFVIPILGLALIALGLIVTSFGFALLESRKIKKIEPYKLLISE